METMNFYTETIKLIRDREDSMNHKQSSEASMFLHLVELMGEDGWNRWLKPNMNQYDSFDSFFYRWHKDMRQCDCYNIEAIKEIGRSTDIVEVREWREKAEDEDGFLMKTGNKDNPLYYQRTRIGGHLDMLFWNLVHSSDEPYKVLEKIYKAYKAGKNEVSFWDD